MGSALVLRQKESGPLLDLTDKEYRFVHEYCVDYNGIRSVKASGYKASTDNSARVLACRMLKKKKIKDAIRFLERKTIKKLGIDREEVLLQLMYCLTQTAEDFVDEQGHIITDIRELSPRARAVIQDIKQIIHYDDEGNVESLELQLIKVPKIKAIEMAMKHKGLMETLAQELQEYAVPWDDMFERQEGKGAIEQEIEAEEKEGEVKDGYADNP